MNEIEEVFNRYLKQQHQEDMPDKEFALKTCYLGAALMLKALSNMADKNTTMAPITFQTSMFVQEIDSKGIWKDLWKILKDWRDESDKG